MTIPYNASPRSIVEYLKEYFDRDWVPALDTENQDVKGHYLFKWDNRQDFILKDIDFSNLRKALNFFIFIDYPKLSELLIYLKEIAKVSNKLIIPVIWKLPSGLIVNQQFYEKKTIQIKPFEYSKNTLIWIVLNKKKFNENKQKIALMPNLVHSLDAASLCLLIESYFSDNNSLYFYSIHDCFAVPCTFASALHHQKQKIKSRTYLNY